MSKQDRKPIKIAALSDIHVTERSHTKYQSLFRDISHNADVLVLCGDLTDHGLSAEAEVLATELQSCTIPKVAVFGNHDYESGEKDEVKRILRSSDLILLEDEEYVYEDVGFAGIKGFGGGFGKYMLGSFGEGAIKDFVSAAIAEVERLEISLDNIDYVEKKVVLMHYSPTPTTLTGEPLEIFPFLGSSRFEDVIDRYDTSVVFHGHAHFGSPEGHTKLGVPVYNVAYPLMQKIFEDKPYRIVEI